MLAHKIGRGGGLRRFPERSRPATCPMFSPMLYSPFGPANARPHPARLHSGWPCLRHAFIPRGRGGVEGFQCSYRRKFQTEGCTVSVISMKSLLEAGVHFGHRTRRWHPKMRTFIFTERNGIHIIDLQQTMRQVNTAYQVVRDAVREGGLVLFVGTKKQAQETIRGEAERCGMPFITT